MFGNQKCRNVRTSKFAPWSCGCHKDAASYRKSPYVGKPLLLTVLARLSYKHRFRKSPAHRDVTGLKNIDLEEISNFSPTGLMHAAISRHKSSRPAGNFSTFCKPLVRSRDLVVVIRNNFVSFTTPALAISLNDMRLYFFTKK